MWRSLIGLVFIGWLAPGLCRGQVFEPGYLVTTTGDTLRGELENRFWQRPPDGVVYRQNAAVPGRFYPRTRLRTIRLEGGRYFRAEVVPVDQNARTQVASLPSRLVINQRPDSLLTEVLVDGPVPLLRAVIGGVTHYFVRRPGQPYLELSERKYLADVGGRQRIKDANNYASQLTVYFGDCPAAIAAAETAPFTPKGLAGVVQTFRLQCTGSREPGADFTALERPRRPFAYNWGILAGAGYNHLKIGQRTSVGEEAPLLDNLNLDGRLHPGGGLYLDVLLPGRRWAGHGELALSTFGRRGTYALAQGAGSYTWYGTKLDARLGVRYLFRQTLTQELFVGSGFNLNFTPSYQSREQYGTGSSRLTAGNVRVPTTAAFFGATVLEPAPYVEVGVRRGRFTFSLDAGPTGGVRYKDPLAVYIAYRPANTAGAEITDYQGYLYTGTFFTGRAMLAFRLSGRSD